MYPMAGDGGDRGRRVGGRPTAMLCCSRCGCEEARERQATGELLGLVALGLGLGLVCWAFSLFYMMDLIDHDELETRI